MACKFESFQHVFLHTYTILTKHLTANLGIICVVIKEHISSLHAPVDLVEIWKKNL